ncbi:MAG TPA: hypothetical protein VG652_01300 [Gaiellaceae bacterium]|nr:hypothetical protein [Gaiellaceae bacterium]
MTKVVILLGAGATLADVATKPRKQRPPLDKRFFSDASLTTQKWRVEHVRTYMKQTYDRDVMVSAHDSLEGVMGQIYTDLFNPLLEASALDAFRQLIKLFNTRLAATTNDIRATNKRLLYRIIASYLSHGVKPSDLTIVTFNQDIQVEKTLDLMSTVDRWRSIAEEIFNFPGLYSLGPSAPEVTFPARAPEESLFPQKRSSSGCIKLLKLHGSLNWYSTHSSATPTRAAMFKANRKIRITSRRTIDPNMTLTGKQRKMFTLPVIVPPVSHKSAVIHQDMAPLWRQAEEALKEADELIIFGYSCPPLDFESSNQLRRSQLNRTVSAAISLIDPEPAIAARYISLLDARCLRYYASAADFIKNG